MATLAQILENSKKISEPKITRELFLFIRRIENEFLDRNKEQITNDSTDIFEKALGYYSEATEYITLNNALLGKGGPIKMAGDPFTGKDTGDWLNGFYVQIVNNVIRFGSNDPKNGKILQGEHWLTTEFFGLTDKNLKEVISKLLLPFLLTQSRKTLDI